VSSLEDLVVLVDDADPGRDDSRSMIEAAGWVGGGLLSGGGPEFMVAVLPAVRSGRRLGMGVGLS
jgi:hypothetical protein